MIMPTKCEECLKNMNQEQKYPQAIIDCIDKYFPKGKDKRRGEALVLQAVSFLEGKRQGIKEVMKDYEPLMKRCFAGWTRTIYEWRISIWTFTLLCLMNLIAGILIGVQIK